MKNYYVLLTGAKINFGDFLITNRAIKLLEKYIPSFSYHLFNNWENLQDKINIINKSKGLILLGGPGYQIKMYPHVFPLVKNLDMIKVPISYIGGGIYGKNHDKYYLKKYIFSKESKKLLNKIIDSKGIISVRDKISYYVLKNNGFNEIYLTGCPAFYNLNKAYSSKNNIKNVSFSAPQKKIYYSQFLKLINIFKLRFPNFNITVHFNRGIGNNKYSSFNESKNTNYLSSFLKKRSINFEDISGNGDFEYNSNKYDLHIGYRVHSHVLFLSSNKPSILLNEDSRGKGISDTLSSLSFDAYTVGNFYKLIYKLFPITVIDLFEKTFKYKTKNNIYNQIMDMVDDIKILKEYSIIGNNSIEKYKITMIDAIRKISGNKGENNE